MIELPPSARIQEMEAALLTDGHVVERTFTDARGWEFFVDGELVAQGDAMGLLQTALRKMDRQGAPGNMTLVRMRSGDLACHRS